MEHADLTPASAYGVIRPHFAKRPRLTVVPTPTNNAEWIVKGAFADWAHRYRKTRPALYKRVDRELAKSDRQPRTSQLGSLDYSGPMSEYPRCGFDFPTRGQKHARFCSLECHDEHRDWCRRTGRRFFIRKTA